MKSISWNQMSELGLIERINREILHPFGLAVSRDIDTGCSKHILVADDGVWTYAEDMPTTIISDDEVRVKLSELEYGECEPADQAQLIANSLSEAVMLISKVFTGMVHGESAIVIVDAEHLPGLKAEQVQLMFCNANNIPVLYTNEIKSEGKTILFFTTECKTFAGYNGHTVVITFDGASEQSMIMSAGISLHKRWKRYVVDINQSTQKGLLYCEQPFADKFESIHEYASMILLHLTDENSHSNQHIKHFVEQIKLHCQHNGTKGE